MLFLLKYIEYYQIGQIGVGPRTNFQQIGTNDMEWLTCDRNLLREINEWSHGLACEGNLSITRKYPIRIMTFPLQNSDTFRLECPMGHEIQGLLVFVSCLGHDCPELNPFYSRMISYFCLLPLFPFILLESQAVFVVSFSVHVYSGCSWRRPF